MIFAQFAVILQEEETLALQNMVIKLIDARIYECCGCKNRFAVVAWDSSI